MTLDLRREFLAPPEGEVPEQAHVVRPSLWAGVEAVGRLLATLLPVLLPFLLSFVLGRFFGDGEVDVDDPLVVVLFDRAELFVGLLLVVVPVVRVAFTRYVVDADGLRVTSTLLQRSDQRVPWEKVTAIRHRRSLLGALVGVETIEVVAYGKRGATLRLEGLRDAAALRALVARRMRETATVAALVRND